MTADRISRRAFLRSITAGGASLISIGPALARGALCAAPAAAQPVEWALLSDTHISADPDRMLNGGKPRERLQRILDDVLTCRDTLSGVVINGDLAVTKGLPGDYVALFDLLAPLRKAKLPVYLLLGNHDDRTPMQHVFGENPGDAPPVEGHRTCVVDSGPVRLVMLDSLIRPNYTPGRLGEVQLRWLMHRLDEASDRPCILFLHHTLSFDGKSLEDDAQLMAIITPRPQVKAVFQGHSHVYRFRKVDGIHIVELLPAGCGFAPSQPVGWVHARFDAQGCVLESRVVDGNRALHGRKRRLRWRPDDARGTVAVGRPDAVFTTAVTC